MLLVQFVVSVALSPTCSCRKSKSGGKGKEKDKDKSGVQLSQMTNAFYNLLLDPNPKLSLSEADMQALKGFPRYDDQALATATTQLIGKCSLDDSCNSDHVCSRKISSESDEFATVEEKVKASMNAQNEVRRLFAVDLTVVPCTITCTRSSSRA